MPRPSPPVLVKIPLLAMLLMLSGCAAEQRSSDGGPPAAPARVSFSDGRLTLEYDGAVIFSGSVTSAAEVLLTEVISETGPVTQAIRLQADDLRSPFTLHGEVSAGPESFGCEVDRRRTGLDIVRHASGPSRSRLNRAVYDRRSDWVLSVDLPTRVTVTPQEGRGTGNSFDLEAEGAYITLRFRPRWYGQHRGLEFFRPWENDVWPESVAGWCSWFAYGRDIDEATLRRAAEVFGRELRPFGYTYFQMDDGYQRDPGGPPETWLTPNEKFPSGLTDLAARIRAQGLVPGIWTYASFHDRAYVQTHPERFVQRPGGEPAHGMWVGYVMDASIRSTLDEIVRPIYRGLKEMGWGYFKVDALRHLRYEGYNSSPQYFAERGLDRVEVFRDFALAVREEIGPESFMLGCWGIRPELIGIIDGCRIGGDGFSYAGLAQYNSFNNVIWRNDPDHVELTPEEAWRSCMVTSLTGSLLMLTDRPERYESALAEPARRAAPVLFTRPGQIFDVDPSRSMYLGAVDTEVSGDGHRIFDANLTPRCDLFLLEVNRDFDSWVVLGRMGGDDGRIPFYELGLDRDGEYHVHEFWAGRYLGSFTQEFSPGPIDPRFGCQLFAIRPVRDHPQILSTSRHISCGGLELAGVRWEDGVLTGRSGLVAGDDYTITFSEPPGGWICTGVACDGARVTGNYLRGGVRRVTLRSDAAAEVTWTLRYRFGGN